MKIEIETVEVKPREGVDLSGWTVEEGPSVSVIGAGAFELLDPPFYKKVCEHLGHDCWFVGKEGDGPSVIATGDPFDDPEDWEVHLIP